MSTYAAAAAAPTPVAPAVAKAPVAYDDLRGNLILQEVKDLLEKQELRLLRNAKHVETQQRNLQTNSEIVAANKEHYNKLLKEAEDKASEEAKVKEAKRAELLAELLKLGPAPETPKQGTPSTVVDTPMESEGDEKVVAGAGTPKKRGKGKGPGNKCRMGCGLLQKEHTKVARMLIRKMKANPTMSIPAIVGMIKIKDLKQKCQQVVHCKKFVEDAKKYMSSVDFSSSSELSEEDTSKTTEGDRLIAQQLEASDGVKHGTGKGLMSASKKPRLNHTYLGSDDESGSDSSDSDSDSDSDEE